MEILGNDDSEQLCYNRGCGQTFINATNTEVSCKFHPGVPFFHDAYKGWTCCNRKCIDFSEFLAMPGCAMGFHSNVKPVSEEPKKVVEEKEEEEKIMEKVIREQMSRPDPDSPMSDMKQTIAPSLSSTPSLQSSNNTAETPAKTCLNQGCNLEYKDRDSNTACTHHPGEAIFHEGLKFWSCCKKKSMEFDEFLNQKGCAQGEHLWFAKKKVDCRIDWHQTSTHVILTLYTKGYDFRNVMIKANGVKLKVSIELPAGIFLKEWILYGIIDEKESAALLQTTKIEMKLRKAEPLQWVNLTQ